MIFIEISLLFCCAAGRTVGHERDQEGKYASEGGSDRGESEGHGAEPKGGIMDSDQQQFCLKWNSFGTNLLTASLNLFKNESLTDVTLFCEGKSLVNIISTRFSRTLCMSHLAIATENRIIKYYFFSFPPSSLTFPYLSWNKCVIANWIMN